MEIGTEKRIRDERGVHGCGNASTKLSAEWANGRGDARIGGESHEFIGSAGVSDARPSVVGRVGSGRVEISDIVSVMVEPREAGSYRAHRCTSAVDAAPRFLP